jgi:energy-coupling factor transport system ATP-binding protein
MISIKDLSFRYNGASENALSDINLEIADGGFLGIIGSSGAGKSTLTYALNGVVPHHYRGSFYGSVTVNGMDTVDSIPEKIASLAGSVFQDRDAQLLASVVEDEILFGLENFGVPHGEIEARVRQALEGAGIPELRKRQINSLSGGQKQKVAIASIIALRPKIIVLDEPTGELDPLSSKRVFLTLKELNEKLGITIIIVEQKIMLLCEFAKRLAVMEKGALILEGEVKDVLEQGEKLENAGVNIPRVSTLALALKEKGLYKGSLPVNLEQAEGMMRGILR